MWKLLGQLDVTSSIHSTQETTNQSAIIIQDEFGIYYSLIVHIVPWTSLAAHIRAGVMASRGTELKDVVVLCG